MKRFKSPVSIFALNLFISPTKFFLLFTIKADYDYD